MFHVKHSSQKAGPPACLFCFFLSVDIFVKQLKSHPEHDIMNFTAVNRGGFPLPEIHAGEGGAVLWAKPSPSSTKRAA